MQWYTRTHEESNPTTNDRTYLGAKPPSNEHPVICTICAAIE